MANKNRSLLFGFLGLSVLTMACHFTGSPDKNAIRCYRFEVQTPSYDSKGKLDSTVTISSSFYTYGDWRIYENFDYVLDRDPNNGSSRYDKHHLYFVFQKDSIYGYQYDAGNAGHAERLLADSLKKKWPGVSDPAAGARPNLEQSIANGRLKQAYTHKDEGSGRWMEAYTDTSIKIDTFFLYFSPPFKALPPDLHLSLSSRLDSLRHAKLVKMIIQWGPQSEKGENAPIGRTAITVGLTEPDAFDRDSVSSYFVRYWRDCRSGSPPKNR